MKEFVAGIDVSKGTFDIAVSLNRTNSEVSKACFSNNPDGYDKCAKWLKKQRVCYPQVLVCMENTGIYHRGLAKYLSSQGALVWVETAVQIKWSMGIQRGKSDKVDCERILLYSLRNQDRVKPFQERDTSIQQVSDYLSLRARIQTCIKSLKVPVKELKNVGLIQESKALEKASSQSIQSLEKELKLLDKQILKVLLGDEELARLYELVSSVRCVGFVAATHIIVHTNGFKRFTSAKQFASFAGVAPFEFSSGTSIKGRTRVHPMANKTMKTILHMCAVSSIRHNQEMRKYFARKVGEGKNKMLVLNSVRNKIIARVFSCVKNQRMYQEDYSALAS